MPQPPTILLSFDVEEFDLPLEFNLPISVGEQFAVGKKGLDVIENILQDQQIATTLFTTANFALQYPDTIALLSSSHEIASHSFYHTGFKQEDLINSRMTLEKICGKKITGFRMPRLQPVDMDWLSGAGYSYDSSINPTTIPGRYNLRHLPRTVYQEKKITRVPCSVTPNLRLPLFWLAFKNLPYAVYKKMALQTLKKDGYLSLYFHPWEFTDLSSYKLPVYIKRMEGMALAEKMERLIKDLKNEAEFKTMQPFLAGR